MTLKGFSHPCLRNCDVCGIGLPRTRYSKVRFLCKSDSIAVIYYMTHQNLTYQQAVEKVKKKREQQKNCVHNVCVT